MTKLTLAADFPEVSQEQWTSQVEATLKSSGIERLVTKTRDDIAVQPIYPTPKDVYASLETRQTTTKAWEAASWDIIQRADIPDINAANEQILDDLKNGANGIALVVPGAVSSGLYGVPVNSVADIKRLMKDVELDLISLRLDAGANGLQVASDVLQVYQDRNLDLSRCDLKLAIDPVGGFAISGVSAGADELASSMTKVLHVAREAGHKANVFSADGRCYHEAGASQAQELGFAIAAIVQQLRLLEQGGVDLADIWPQMGLTLSADADQFLTIAKLRAAHLVWLKLQEAMGVEASPLNLDVETSLAMMSQRDPYVNMLRTTTAAFAAGIGGASSVCVLPFTSAIGVAERFGRRMARNSQVILQEESSIGLVGDAAAGSGYVEAVTSQIAEKAWAVLQDIEAAGGMLDALVSGQVQMLIAQSAAKTTKDISTRKQPLVGVSEFASLEDTPVKVLDYKPVAKQPNEVTGGLKCKALGQVSISAPFELLRDQAEAMTPAPEVRLVNLGQQSEFAARATWITNLLAAGGIKASDNDTAGKIACICSSDAVYSEQAAATAKQLKADGFEFVYLAGRPGELADALKASGVDDFIFAGCDVLVLLQKSLKMLGE